MLVTSGDNVSYSNTHTHTHTPTNKTKQAHEVYLRTAIGNAPWPIGLTMVGIHERTGREKISSSKVRGVIDMGGLAGLFWFLVRSFFLFLFLRIEWRHAWSLLLNSFSLTNMAPKCTYTHQVAHIMNNEMQRKYLTSIKRLMRFAQVRASCQSRCIASID